MKVIDLRINAIEPEVGEAVIIIQNDMSYKCVVLENLGIRCCEECQFLECDGCDSLLCGAGQRKDKKNIILKCISRKITEVSDGEI